MPGFGSDRLLCNRTRKPFVPLSGVCVCPHGLADSRELSKERASPTQVPVNTISIEHVEPKLSQAVTEPDRCGKAAVSQFNLRVLSSVLSLVSHQD